MATGIQPPNEVTCDYSRALIAAIIRVFFKSSSTDGYVNYIFKLLICQEKKAPTTYVYLFGRCSYDQNILSDKMFGRNKK
jgi:hypothetical protein